MQTINPTFIPEAAEMAHAREVREASAKELKGQSFINNWCEILQGQLRPREERAGSVPCPPSGPGPHHRHRDHDLHQRGHEDVAQEQA